MDSKAGRVGVSPWSDLPLNRILYIPLSIFAYSSNIFIASLDLMVSMLVLGTLKNSRFFLRSSSFMDRAPVMKLICSTNHPRRCIVLLSDDLRVLYCSSTTHLALTTYRLVTSDILLNSIKQITPTLVFVGIFEGTTSGGETFALVCSTTPEHQPCETAVNLTGPPTPTDATGATCVLLALLLDLLLVNLTGVTHPTSSDVSGQRLCVTNLNNLEWMPDCRVLLVTQSDGTGRL